MSKAEERALEAYPIVVSQYSDNCKEYDSNESDRLTFIEGYRQAEKDLELTCGDLKLLQDISNEVFEEVVKGSVDFYQIYPTEQSYLEEVLKRFRKMK